MTKEDLQERAPIHLLAAWILISREGKLPISECLGIAEAAILGAEVEDMRIQTALAAEEKAAQPPTPITDKIQ